MNETKLHICKCLLNKLNNNKLKDISVKELYLDASISRTTFYKYFKNTKEVILFYYEYIKNKYYLKHKDIKLNLLDFIYNYLNFIYENKHFFTILFKNNLTNIIFARINELYNATGIKFSNYFDAYFTYGLYGVINEWIKNEFNSVPKELLNNIRLGYDKMNKLIDVIVN